MVEGVDGSGKSTLIKAVVARLEQLKGLKNIKVVADGEALIPTHPKHPSRLTPIQLIEQLNEMVKDDSTVYVCDRGPISDIIYRTFDEHDPLLNLGELFTYWIGWVNRIVIVYCNSTNSEELMLARGDDNPIAIEHHKQLRYLFSQVMSMFSTFEYDVATMGDKMPDAVNTILAKLWAGIERHNTLSRWDEAEQIK
jgi:thymidylate kinase